MSEKVESKVCHVMLPKQSFFIEYSVCRHVHGYEQIRVGIEMDKGDVADRKVLGTNGSIDERKNLEGENASKHDQRGRGETCQGFARPPERPAEAAPSRPGGARWHARPRRRWRRPRLSS